MGGADHPNVDASDGCRPDRLYLVALQSAQQERLGFQRVQCGFDVANAASARVNAKVGFTVEGDLKGYGPTGDAAMRADGWIAAETNRMTALDPQTARAQPWYGPMRDRVQVLDWMGRPA